MSIKATIWDFSGVLIKPLVPDPHTFIAREVGIDPVEFARYFDGVGNAGLDLGEESEDEFYKRIINDHHLKMDAMRIFDRYFFDLFELNVPLIDFIRASHPPMKTAICSNFSRLLRSLLEKKWKVDHLFDVLVISSEVKLLKPDARIYQMTLDRLAVGPREAVFVDDTEKNVLAARELGMHGILFKDNLATLNEIKNLMGLNGD
jgi:putative hydrolase of the HAD superfamily